LNWLKIQAYDTKSKLPLRVPHSSFTQRVDVMGDFLLCQKNTSMGDACGGTAGCSYNLGRLEIGLVFLYGRI
jgi:hypothetical protein